MPPLRVLVPSWRDLRSLGSSKAVGLSVFVPIIGYYVLYSDTINELLQLNQNIFQSQYKQTGIIGALLGLPRPHTLYFGLVGVAIGSLVYYALCPFLIKENESATAYFRSYEHAASSYEIEFVVRRIERILDSNDQYYQYWIKRIELSYGSIFTMKDNGPLRANDIYHEVVKSRNHDAVVVKEQLRLALAAVTSFRYSIENRSRTLARLLCAAFYAFGFLLVGLASLQVVVQIILSMLR